MSLVSLTQLAVVASALMLERQALEELLTKAREDPLPLFERAFWITTKGLPGQPPLTRLKVNYPQKRIDEAICLQRENGMPPRVIVLKARQPGCSTYCEARITHTALTRPYSTSLIVAHIEEGVQKLFRKCTFALDRLPPEIRPIERKRKTTELTLSHVRCSDGDFPLESNIVAASAAGQELWRGMTIHTAHLSEFGYFPYPEKTLAGLMQAVPKTPDSLVIIESTANGEGNCFHNEWVRAEAGESAFVPIFIPWWELPDAWMKVPKDFELEDDELEMKKAYGLANEQIQWRRFVLYTELQGDEDAFQQEYPATAQEAFLTSGHPAFPVKPLQEMYERARKVEPMRGDVLLTEETGPAFVRDRRGALAIYIMPKEGHDYCIGGDPSAGVEGGDPAAMCVFDRNTDEIVAVWHGLISPIDFGQKMMALGKLYNDAWLAPEITGGCIYAKSLVNLPNGDVPIEDLVGKEPWLFGYANCQPILAKAAAVVPRRRAAKCVRVSYRWQSGRKWRTDSLVCTPEHPILAFDGRYICACDLKPGVRLRAFSQYPYRKRPGSALRMQIRTGCSGTWKSRARWIWEQLGGCIPKGWHIHHLDGDVLNDDPANLTCVPGAKHNAYHSREWFKTTDPERLARRGAKIAAKRRARMHEAAQRPEVRARKAEVTASRNRVGGDLWRRKYASGGANHVVVSVEPAGEQEVYDIRVPGVENFAVNGIFVHNHGFVVIDEIKRNFYGRVYVYQRVDKIRNTITNFLGWETTFRTRGLLLDSMHWAIGQHAIMIWDLETITELKQMRYIDSRRAEGIGHDDLSMACMIAYRAHLEMPMIDTGMPPRVRIPTEKKPQDELPAMPKSGISRVAWQETDKVMRSMRSSRRRPLDEAGIMSDPEEDERWEPGSSAWVPEILW